MGALVASLLTFVVFALSILMLAAQVASGQLTPRVIARIFESPLIKLVLSSFMFSYTYSLGALGRIEDHVPELPVVVACLSSLLSVVLFLYLMQRVSQGFRPIIVLSRVAADTGKVIRAVHPNMFVPEHEGHSCPELDSMVAKKVIAHNGLSGVVLAFDAAGLAKIARRTGCIIELVPQVGDFLSTGEDMFRLRGLRGGFVNDARSPTA